MRNRKWFAGLAVLIAGVIVYSVFFKEQNWAGEQKVNPILVDEIVISQQSPNPYMVEQGFRVRDDDWTGKVLATIKEIDQVQKPDLTNMPDYTIRVKGEFEVSVFTQVSTFPNQSVMSIEGKYYETPQSFLEMISGSKEQFAMLEDVEYWADWNPFVMIEGEPYFAQYTEQTLKGQPLQKAFTVDKQLPENPSADLKISELEDHTSVYPKGTPVYELNGLYYVRNAKETDQFDRLLPYGKKVHKIRMDGDKSVQYWHSGDANYFVVHQKNGSYQILAAEDPASAEECLLKWDSKQELFRSPCSGVTYKKNGKSNKSGFAAMQVFPSSVKDNIITFSFY